MAIIADHLYLSVRTANAGLQVRLVVERHRPWITRLSQRLEPRMIVQKTLPPRLVLRHARLHLQIAMALHARFVVHIRKLRISFVLAVAFRAFRGKFFAGLMRRSVMALQAGTIGDVLLERNSTQDALLCRMTRL